MGGHDIIAIGASAGGVETLQRLVGSLPRDIPAAIFVVQHTSPESPGLFANILERSGPLKAKYPKNGEHFHPGTIYVAKADHHLLVKKDHVLVTRGPRENRMRPAIDPLFRSAAAAYGPKVVGVVLTGMLDDGTAGLFTVKRCGGVACVQDPGDALYPEMPQSALENVQVDYRLPVSELGSLLDHLARTEASSDIPIPEDVVVEARIAEKAMSDINIIEKMGTKSPFGCPECGGGIWEIKNDPVQRFRCNTGHAFTARTLLASQNETIERALWAAVRSLEERANMLARLARDEKGRGRNSSSRDYGTEADEAKRNAQYIRELLLHIA